MSSITAISTIFYFLGVVHNGMQVDNVFLKVPSRAIPGSLKASMSLTGMMIQLFIDQPPRVCYRTRRPYQTLDAVI